MLMYCIKDTDCKKLYPNEWAPEDNPTCCKKTITISENLDSMS